MPVRWHPRRLVSRLIFLYTIFGPLSFTSNNRNANVSFRPFSHRSIFLPFRSFFLPSIILSFHLSLHT